MIKRQLFRLAAAVLCLLLAGCAGTAARKTASSSRKAASVSSAVSSSPLSGTSAVSSGTTASVSSASASLGGQPSSAASAHVAVSVAIPDGYSVPQTAAALESAGVCTKADFLDKVNSYPFKQRCVQEIPYDSGKICYRLEGYLYPDTYQFYKNMDAEDVIGRMLNDADQHIAGKYDFKTVIIASILEKEVPDTNGMKNAASVINNRLADTKDFPYLGMNSTLHYLTWYMAGVSNNLVEKYKYTYNTISRVKGLPAGPICSPSGRALDAAANPASTDYLYFLTDTSGVTHFSATAIAQ